MKTLIPFLFATLIFTSSYGQNSPFSIWGAGLDGSTYQQTAIFSIAPNGLLFEAPLNSSMAKLPIEFNWRGGGTPALKILPSGNVGIGTTNPAQKLTVLMDGSTNGTGIAVQAVNHNGTGSQPGTAYLNETGIKRMYSYLDIATDTYNIANAASSNILSITQAGNVSIGTTNAQGYMFAVNGSAIATSMTIKLNANWPDYVFKKDYQLPTLQDVKTYIDQNQHLPDIPSAAEIAKDGQNLGEMNKLLVKKVEELTLYLIEQGKQLADQQKALAIQQEEISKLKQEVAVVNK